MTQDFKLDNLYFDIGETPVIEIKDSFEGKFKINNQNIFIEESGNPFIVMDKASKLSLTNTNIKRIPKGHIERIETNIKKLKDKHHKATNKVTELVKENKTLKQTILLMEENQRQKEKFWKSGSTIATTSLTNEEQTNENKELLSDILALNKRLKSIEKELNETQEDNLVYYDILSTLLNDPEQAINVYMQGRRRGQLDE